MSKEGNSTSASTSNLNINNSMTIQEVREKVELDYFVDEISMLAWPILIVAFVVIFRKQLRDIMDILSNAKEVSIGNVTWKTNDLEDAVIDLEIIKSAILMAGIDGVYEERETRLLESKVGGMEDYLGKISEKGKGKVLSEIIMMAAADKKIVEKEYILLKSKAEKLDISVEHIDQRIVNYCVTQSVEPPQQLKVQYEQRKKELGCTNSN